MNWMSRWIHQVYDGVLALSTRQSAMYWLFAVAFVESSFFPIPPDIMLIPMVLAMPQKAWRIAGVATIASVLGGYFGYGIGMFLFDTASECYEKAYRLNGRKESLKECLIMHLCRKDEEAHQKEDFITLCMKL